jgi:hypothetical protein
MSIPKDELQRDRNLGRTSLLAPGEAMTRIERFYHSLPREPFAGKRTFRVDIGAHQLVHIFTTCEPCFMLHSLHIDDVEQMTHPFPLHYLRSPHAHLHFTRSSNPHKIVTLEVENVGLRTFPTFPNRKRLSLKRWRWLGPPHLDLSPRPFLCALVTEGACT